MTHIYSEVDNCSSKPKKQWRWWYWPTQTLCINIQHINIQYPQAPVDVFSQKSVPINIYLAWEHIKMQVEFKAVYR